MNSPPAFLASRMHLAAPWGTAWATPSPNGNSTSLELASRAFLCSISQTSAVVTKAKGAGILSNNKKDPFDEAGSGGFAGWVFNPFARHRSIIKGRKVSLEAV
uniref:Putative secreted protein n=1 Tax=Ixodes ricinus TaxID=34613 RepID=A0A6B0UFF7_IXORI